MDLLAGVIRDYEWGDPQAIAKLLGHEPPGHPEAEYWLGAHPSAPSRLVSSDHPTDRTLDVLVAEEMIPVMGPRAAERFSGLPFLLKVLAAARPLSIQAHPSLEQAKAGFARENAAGIDLASPQRSYRDANHKPELICALTPFEAKCGFRSVAESHRLISAMDEPMLRPLTDMLAADGSDAEILAQAVPWLLSQPTGDAAAMADAAVGAAHRYLASDSEPFRTVMTWTGRIAEAFPGDIGVVVALLLNHVSLAPGEAVFLKAGNLHSYLRGVGVELMATSDNVLRGGLTPKHIDVDELLKVVDYTPANPPIQRPTGAVHTFASPVPEFSLTRLDSTADGFDGASFHPDGPEIVLVTSGGLTLETAGGSLDLAVGSTALVRHDDGPYRVRDTSPGHTVAWRAGLGSDLY